MNASQISDRESLEKWLEDKPPAWAQAIAPRAALRVLPLVLSVHEIQHEKLTETHKRNLTLTVFQASFISCAACKFPVHDFTASSATRAANDAADAASRAASRAADAAAYAADASAHAAHTATAVVADVVADVASRAANAAADAVVADVASRAADAAVYAAVRADGEWLEQNGQAHNPAETAQQLMQQRLWLPPTNAPKNYQSLQYDIEENLEGLRWTKFVQEHAAFGLIPAWYHEAAEGLSLFGEEKDINLATQKNEFWEGDAIKVMERVVKLVGWLHERTLVEYSAKIPYGISFQIGEGQFEFEFPEEDGDLVVAQKLFDSGRIEGALLKAEMLVAKLGQLSDHPSWEDLPVFSNRLVGWLKSKPQDLAKKVGLAWDISVSLGTFAELDDKISDKDNFSNEIPLNNSIRRALDDVLATMATLIREFPTGMEMDNKHRDWNEDRSVLEEAKAILLKVEKHQLLFEDHLKILNHALSLVNLESTQGKKNAAFGSGSTRKLVLAVALLGGVTSGIVSGVTNEIGAEISRKTGLSEKSASFTLDAKKEIQKFLKDSPADVKASMKNIIEKIEELSEKYPKIFEWLSKRD